MESCIHQWRPQKVFRERGIDGARCISEGVKIPQLTEKLWLLHFFYDSRVIFGPPVTTESRGRFESGFRYFEVFKKNWAPMPPAKVWAKPRRGQNPKWPPAAILDLLKSVILRRFYSNYTIEVSFLTNSEVRNPFQGLFFQLWPSSPWNPRWPPFYQW